MREIVGKKKVWWNYDIQHVYRMLRYILKPLPRRIIELLSASPEGISVTEMYNLIGTEQSVCSQALAILRRYQIVTTVRDGKYIYYSLNQSRLEQINQAVKNLNH